MSSLSKTKGELRKQYKEKRKALGEAQRAQLSKKIARRFVEEIALWGQEKVFVFLPIERFAEIDTYALIDTLRKQYPVLQLVLSRTELGGTALHTFRWTANTQIHINEWGIPEPEGGPEVPANEIDLAIIPLLAYDLQGHRVGYGKGYYDRFLAQCRPGMRRIGLSFFTPEAEIADTDAHDIPLDACVPPEQVIFF